LDLEEAGGESVLKSAVPAPRPAAHQSHGAPRAATRVAGPRTLVGRRKSSAEPEDDGGVARQALVPATPPAKRAPVPRIDAKAPNAGKSTARASPPSKSMVRTGSKNRRLEKKSKIRAPAIELTPDGFVKWWK
jgi:hypothetical protein